MSAQQKLAAARQWLAESPEDEMDVFTSVAMLEMLRANPFPDCTASHAKKLRRAKAYVAKMKDFRYVSGQASVLLPVALRAVQRVQERRHD